MFTHSNCKIDKRKMEKEWGLNCNSIFYNKLQKIIQSLLPNTLLGIFVNKIEQNKNAQGITSWL